MKVFLTGASAGIGAETARILCQAGHQVWGSSRSLERLPVLSGFHPVQLDLLDASAALAICDEIWKQSGGFDVLINNAGQAVFGPLESMSALSIREQFELMFFGPLFLQQDFMTRMRAGKGGLVINVTSLATELPIPFMGPYSAAKAAFSAATTALRLEMIDQRVRCIDLRPGDISTNFNQAVTRDKGAGIGAARSTWDTIEKNMAAAPSAASVAERILDLIEGRRFASIQRVGDWFQTVLAPLGPRLLPSILMEKLIRKYYGIKSTPSASASLRV